jgi:(2R)-3-sulfolactate dehydrogenase (NADP+)
MTRNLTLDQVFEVARDALLNSGAEGFQADPVARSIRDAEAEGTRSIGLSYLPYYCKHLEIGKIAGTAQPQVSKTAPGLLKVDAANGFAHPAYEMGEQQLVSMAKEQGIALMGISNAYACGVLGYFTRRIANQGLICIMTSNTSSAMAPWGGKTPFLGTNPWSFSVPRTEFPLVIDSSSTATAYVNVANAAASGASIPSHWALDSNGKPTTNPNSGLAGSIAPAGGHKGAALALMVEVLSAGLTYSNWSHQASNLGNDEGGPPMLGQTFIVIRPDGLGANDMAERLERMLTEMTTQEGVRVPGDRKQRNREHAEQFGVDVDDAMWKQLTSLGAG